MLNPSISQKLLEGLLNIDFRDAAGKTPSASSYDNNTSKLNPYLHTNEWKSLSLIKSVFPNSVYLGLLVGAPAKDNRETITITTGSTTQTISNPNRGKYRYIEPKCGDGGILETGAYKRVLLTTLGDFNNKILDFAEPEEGQEEIQMDFLTYGPNYDPQNPDIEDITITQRVVSKVINAKENIQFPYTGSAAIDPNTNQPTEPKAGYYLDPTINQLTGKVNLVTIDHFGIFSQSTDKSTYKDGTDMDNLLIWGPLEQAITVEPNKVPIILRKNLEITLG